MTRNCLTGLLSVSLFAVPCAAQQLASQLKVVKNAPFAATATTTSTQTLADGNFVTRTATTALARDTEGRTRREDTRNNATAVFIHDPITGIAWVLDPATRIARRFAVPSTSGDLTNPGRNDAASDSLGSVIMAGVNVEGTRLTRVLAAGEVGNGLPITITTDTWYSSELQTVVISRTSDPRVGETDWKLTGIQRGEPDHSLFEIPADYSVQDGYTAPAAPKKR